jgi:DNA-binding phage protein
MQDEFAYRGYVIYQDGEGLIAETHLNEDACFFLHMRSRLLERVIGAANDIHSRTNILPEWLAAVWGTCEDAFVDLDIHFVQTTAVMNMLTQEATISAIAKATSLSRQTIYRIAGDRVAAEAALVEWGI